MKWQAQRVERARESLTSAAWLLATPTEQRLMEAIHLAQQAERLLVKALDDARATAHRENVTRARARREVSA